MTVLVVSYTASEIVLVSDEFKYVLKNGVLGDVLSRKLEITHTNLNEHVERIERDSFKIHPLTQNMALCCSGDTSFSDIIQDLNVCEDVSVQILARLQNKNLNAFWTCHIAKFNEQTGKAELTSIIYDRGTIKTKESTQGNISLDSFAPETADLFFKKYVMDFYISNTEEKVKIIQEFFKEITEIFDGNAGGIPIIAKIDKDGFRWVSRPKLLPVQNFTNYSSTWCPEKLETLSTTSVSWSSTDWTNVLDLQFECESTMLIVAFAFMDTELYRASAGSLFGYVKLTLDDVDLPATQTAIYEDGGTGLTAFEVPVHIHTVFTAPKGIHHLKIAMCVYSSSYTIWGFARRLSVLKGYYQGGTT